MKNTIIKLFLFIIWLVWIGFISSASASYWIYYWSNATYAKSLFTKYDVMIMQDYNYNLFKNYTWKKVCYLTIWEFDWDSTQLNNLWLSWAVVWFNPDWNSYIMDMWNQTWVNYLLNEENRLKNLGCNGLFLDTIWNTWYETQAVALTKSLKDNWTNAYIVVNNAHDIKNELVNYVDAYMFENYWQYGTKAWTNDANWYNALSLDYQNLAKTYGKKIYSLSYGNVNLNSSMKTWGNTVVNKCTSYWFEYVIADWNLTKIYK